MSDVWRPDFADPPAFAHMRPWCPLLEKSHWPGLADLNSLASDAGLANAHGRPIRFETQVKRCGQRDYEAGILATGQVPTRARNWHDLLNALTWLALPHTKCALNAVQCQALDVTAPQRGPLADAATLFDESGMVLAGPDPSLAVDLAARRWRRALVDRRSDWAAVTVIAVGHAVLEKLLAPWPGITAKCTFLELPASPDVKGVDEALARLWGQGGITQPTDLFPLPVLGVPGWWPENENPGFYDNEKIFRPAVFRPPRT